MSTRARLSLPALLAIMLAAALGQAPVAAASTARMLPSTRSALATARAPAHLARGAAGFPAVRGQTRTSLLPMPARAAGELHTAVTLAPSKVEQRLLQGRLRTVRSELG
jgi:hypothetical protein